MTSLATLLTRRHGDALWDGVLRVTGLAALAAIPLTLWVQDAGGLVGFFLVTVWVNGPMSPFLPSTYEPILMLVGRIYQPLLVAIVGVIGTIYVEKLNYYLYKHLLRTRALEGFRQSRTVERVRRLFMRAPFFTIWLCSWSIIPYWPVRFLSPLAGYNVWRHLFATFLGRFPRLWLFAALGAWLSVSMTVLVAVSVGSIIIALLIYLIRQGRKQAVGKTPEETPGVGALETADG